MWFVIKLHRDFLLRGRDDEPSRKTKLLAPSIALSSLPPRSLLLSSPSSYSHFFFCSIPSVSSQLGLGTRARRIGRRGRIGLQVVEGFGASKSGAGQRAFQQTHEASLATDARKLGRWGIWWPMGALTFNHLERQIFE